MFLLLVFTPLRSVLFFVRLLLAAFSAVIIAAAAAAAVIAETLLDPHFFIININICEHEERKNKIK